MADCTGSKPPNPKKAFKLAKNPIKKKTPNKKRRWMPTHPKYNTKVRNTEPIPTNTYEPSFLPDYFASDANSVRAPTSFELAGRYPVPPKESSVPKKNEIIPSRKSLARLCKRRALEKRSTDRYIMLDDTIPAEIRDQIIFMRSMGLMPKEFHDYLRDHDDDDNDFNHQL